MTESFSSNIHIQPGQSQPLSNLHRHVQVLGGHCMHPRIEILLPLQATVKNFELK